MSGNNELQIVGPRDQFPKVTLIEPTETGYLMLALEVDRRPPIGFFVQSEKKTRLIAALKAFAKEAITHATVVEATVFKALLIPPGRGALLKERPHVEVARFDLVVLIEFETLEAARSFRGSASWNEMLGLAEKDARKTLSVAASNARRIGPVDHSRDGVFLFNYFYADSLDINLKVWKYTAGWFQDQTGLDNSTLFLPEGDDEDIPYTVINHCRWDKLSDILPSLIFNRTFRPFVLANFEKNSTAAMPVLYRLA